MTNDPNTDTVQTDELADKLIELGFFPNAFLLNLNRKLQVPNNKALPAPWNLPSRLFRYPIEITDAGDGFTRLGLMHPLLADHPFVKDVETALEVTLRPDGAPNPHGHSQSDTALWWHAVDLVAAGLWRELLETAAYTTRENIANAVWYGLQYSPHDGKTNGHLTPAEGRQMMQAVDSPEPSDQAATLLDFSTPHACKQDGGRESWPINGGSRDVFRRAWGIIIGIERGWFTYNRGGFLNWSEAGRCRYDAGDRSSFIETSGQSAFAF
ncbi:hypothetical protein AWB68_07489 [Caballeronia choica]|uniref:Uncharacterized protein n=1 Tax=Caballeronia choica TaxID=326476 RepID=A0A158KVC8_9BURK|nr:hypothetical protein [Caballeronia choica]SAL84905.1 hypothetical protein AWB68_07489 [Caballeronia choica]